MDTFSYVYILESEVAPRRHYTGLTNDLKRRIQKHNQGGIPHTAKFRPWKLRVAIAFPCRDAASQFEAYRKSHSGRAFAAKHL